MKFEGDLIFIETITGIIKEWKKQNVIIKVIPKKFCDEQAVFVFIMGEEEDIRLISNNLMNYDVCYDSIFVVDNGMIVIKKCIKSQPELTQQLLEITIKGVKQINKISTVAQRHKINAVMEWNDIGTVMPIIRDYYKEVYAYESITTEISLKDSPNHEDTIIY